MAKLTFNELKIILDNIDDVPTLPTIASKIIHTANMPLSNAKQMGKVLEKDQALTFKVLRMANSAFYAVKDPVKTVDRAIVVMGFNRVKNIVTRVSAISSFGGSTNSDLFDMTKFWEHCIAVGMTCSILAKQLKMPKPDEMFTAGLLHDIGKLILAQYLVSEFEKIAKKVYSDNCSFIQAERDIIGVDHTHIGKWLANKWRLSKDIKLIISEHHHPPGDDLILGTSAKPIVLVFLADHITRKAHIGFGGDTLIPPINPKIWNIVDQNKINIDQAGKELLENRYVINEYLDISQNEETS
ncbi:HDOD domain-containing protein [bacterium]|nr:HDOD domain-containing protein [bacterium]